MRAEDIEEWLDSWVETHYAALTDRDEAARLCLDAASRDDIPERGLLAAAGGDLAAYLEEEAEAIRQSGRF
ncbi:hypothetical protein [Swaminathania salitolerans]|uniref:DUF768 domain-containing protein n=1 Tax=Swaminathania salitolerans TaxID=182838 RepID=A0A511BUR8_9PROT|nr:hypothetical protein [Swaminathania salitolerans]GBQ12978.1 hypothetical protein AA21291_1366 [Swaminathania salitolerans LMG 21291]GEL03234.1 hypothetical protein SSA02_23970 [Swaminathania salitolerans]